MPTSMVIEAKVDVELSRPHPRFEHGEEPPIHQIDSNNCGLAKDISIEQNKSTFKPANIRFVLDQA